MAIQKTGDWREAKRILINLDKRLQKAEHKATLQEAQFFRSEVVKGFRTGAPGGQRFAPLAATTLAIRRAEGARGRKPLVQRGDLRNNVKVKKLDNGAFVGVLRTARSSKGESLVDIAKIHEYGLQKVIRITKKMRAWMQSRLRKTRLAQAPARSLGFIRIRARPFIRPVANKFFSNRNAVRHRFNKRLSKLLGGDLGRV